MRLILSCMVLLALAGLSRACYPPVAPGAAFAPASSYYMQPQASFAPVAAPVYAPMAAPALAPMGYGVGMSFGVQRSFAAPVGYGMGAGGIPAAGFSRGVVRFRGRGRF